MMRILFWRSMLWLGFALAAGLIAHHWAAPEAPLLIDKGESV